MFNPRIGGIAAGAGFILSFLLGLITGASFPLVLIRALIFAALFFALVSAGYWAIGRYLPDLLDTIPAKDEAVSPPGAQVDISVGDDTEISLNEFMENPGESGGDALDQHEEYSYTETGDLEGTPLDDLPDLDLMSGAFGGESLFDIEAKAEKKGLEGAFAGKNVQEMASAIQTILKREDKG
ncbi:hypothetical protein AGMMS49942_18360 [Spirochaetia bacterium]|nr:hypothetical protein AGMMS49942_18360 [Spirochaetia bacterium]